MVVVNSNLNIFVTDFKNRAVTDELFNLLGFGIIDQLLSVKYSAKIIDYDFSTIEYVRNFINTFNDVTFVNYYNEQIFQMYMVVCIIKQLTGKDIPKDVLKCRILYMHASATPNIFLFPYVLSQLRYFRDNGDWNWEKKWDIVDHFYQ